MRIGIVEIFIWSVCVFLISDMEKMNDIVRLSKVGVRLSNKLVTQTSHTNELRNPF